LTGYCSTIILMPHLINVAVAPVAGVPGRSSGSVSASPYMPLMFLLNNSVYLLRGIH
jgi:hypothetical protein